MTDDPYVLNLPTLVGGYGRAGVRRFYVEDFLPALPGDPTSISRTIGTDRLVDEMVLTVAHDVEMPWFLPGIAPTGRRLEVAMLGVIGFRDGLVASEHLWWDQASVLAQLDLLPPGVPVLGAEIAAALLRTVAPA